jgi:hypothetical protein
MGELALLREVGDVQLTRAVRLGVLADDQTVAAGELVAQPDTLRRACPHFGAGARARRRVFPRATNKL